MPVLLGAFTFLLSSCAPTRSTTTDKLADDETILSDDGTMEAFDSAPQVAIATGRGLVCGLDAAGLVSCRAATDNADSDAVPCAQTEVAAWMDDGVRARAIAAGGNGDTVCIVTSDGTLMCTSQERGAFASPPTGTFVDVVVRFGVACALGADGAISCWGTPREGLAGRHEGPFIDVSASMFTGCGLHADGSVACWGDTGSLDLERMVGPFTSIDGLCGRGADGVVTCWKGETHPIGTRAVRTFTAGSNRCSIDQSGSLACAPDSYAEASPPSIGEGYLQVAAAERDATACALRVDGRVDCWGNARLGCFVPSHGFP